MVREFLLVPLFEKFIRDTRSGKRRKLNGERIKPATIRNYDEALKVLREYEAFRHTPLRIKTNLRRNRRMLMQERDYWKQFYRSYSDFLFHQKNCFDNYAGSNFKIIKCFFRYLRHEKYMDMPDFYENFYVRKEDIRIVTLLPERFCFLVMDEQFTEGLNSHLRRIKDMIVFGCVCALRFNDLMQLKVKEVEHENGEYFAYFRSSKTDTAVHVKLPSFAISIFEKYSRRKRPADRLFPRLSLANFNINIRKLTRLAGWTEIIGKTRSKNGKTAEVKTPVKTIYRFCDLVSSHIMRRTGITILLMLGMPELLVRKISGHAAHSRSFYRYVNFAQSYITDEIDKVHEKLLDLWNRRKA